MKFLKNKFAPIAISIFVGIGLIIGINFLLSKFNKPVVNTGQKSQTHYNYQPFDHEKDVDAIKFYKTRTVSLALLKNESEKVNGTAWLKEVDIKNNEFSFVTNLHVVASFVKYDEASNLLKFNDEFSKLNIHYFNDFNDTKTYIERTDNLNWSIGKHAMMQKRIIPNINEYKNKQNVIKNEKDGMYYINNGYIDYIELVFKPNDKTSFNFNEWLHKQSSLDINNSFISSNELEQLIMNKNDFELFVAGFPLVEKDIKWIEQKIEFKFKRSDEPQIGQSELLEISSTPKIIGVDSWLSKNEKFSIETTSSKQSFQRNIANQIIIRDLIMGNGTSGSMISIRSNSQIKILGIWWGTYGQRFGAGDLLISDNYKPYESKIVPEWNKIEWNAYNLVKS